MEVRSAPQTISKKETFKYFESIIQNCENIDDNITHRIWETCMNRGFPLKSCVIKSTAQT